MRFRELSEPPTREQCLDWPRTEITPQNTPSRFMVKREVRSWMDRLAKERYNNNTYNINVCRMILHGLNKVEQPVRGAEQGLLQVSADNQSVQNELFMDRAAALGFSRLWHEADLDNPKYHQGKYGPAALLSDFYSSHLSMSALHLQDAPLREVAGITPPAPDAEVWLEGDGIYLKATSPATPSPGLDTRFAQVYRESLPVAEYTTLAPRLKVETEFAPPAPRVES